MNLSQGYISAMSKRVQPIGKLHLDKKAWDESKHPRVEAGNEHGGEFAGNNGGNGSTFKKESDDGRGTRIYVDENGYKAIFTKIGTSTYFELSDKNNRIIIPSQNGGTKYGVKETLSLTLPCLISEQYYLQNLGRLLLLRLLLYQASK